MAQHIKGKTYKSIPLYLQIQSGAKSTDGIENIAAKLYREIRGIRAVYNFSSDAKLKEDVSKLFKSIQKSEAILSNLENEGVSF